MTNNNLILIAGSPATGKSSIVETINAMFDNILIISPDDIKEMYADSIGFSNLDEKQQLENQVWKFYYSILRQYMEAGKQVIVSEYPFSMKQYSKLKRFSQDYNYNVITIRLITEFETLWERRYERDRESDRHLSHLMTSYYHGDQLDDRNQADDHITKAEFKEIIGNRKYNEFVLGKLLEVDTTEFDEIDHSSIISFLENNIKI